MSVEFRERYGPWAVVAGASEGLGAQFAEQVAARGLNVVLVARRAELLESLAARLKSEKQVDVRICSADLARADCVEALRRATEGLEVGLVVYNAAFAPVGPWLEQPLEDQLKAVDVNCRGPLLLLHQFGRGMAQRKRGGVVVMSSVAGFQGGPTLSVYAATKAFGRVLAEGLWAELAPHGVDLVACAAGAIRTPNYSKASTREAPGTLDPKDVAVEALEALGRRPVSIPGAVNQLAAFLLGRLLPRRTAVRIMASATRSLQESGVAHDGA